MHLQWEQLRTLASVIDHGSFESAARALSITPSAVSQRIKLLENIVGRVLVVRDRPVSLTESGRIVMRLARQLGALESDMVASLSLDSSELTPLPLVVSADSLATWFLPAIDAVEGVAFDIVREDQAHSKNLLRDGTVMAAITSDPEPVQGCHSRFLGTMTYSPMAGARWMNRWMPLGFDPTLLRSAPVVVFDRKDDLQDSYLRSHGIDPGEPPRHYVPGSQEFVDAVARGFGWGMVPAMQRDTRSTAPGLLALDPDGTTAVPLYWHQWSLDSTALSVVSAAVVAAAASALY